MHELLLPAANEHAQALGAAERYVRRRNGPHWAVLRLLGLPALDPDARSHLTVLVAWHELVRELTDEAPSPAAESAQLELLVSELEGAFQHEPRSVIAQLLRATIRRHQLPALLLRGPLEERRRSQELGTFETRDALLRQARRLAQCEGRLYLRVANPSFVTARTHEAERLEVLVDNLSLALQTTHWLLHWKEAWERGRLRFAMEDLQHHGVTLDRIGASAHEPAWSALCQSQVRWIRAFYANGWSLCDEVGARRGRALAFLLRWHAASLTALEARHYRVDPPPPSGILRVAACLSVSLATRACPRFS